MNVGGLVSEPTLFFTDDGVSMFVDPKERWFVSEVIDRVVSPQTTKVYSTLLNRGAADTNFALRRIELSIRLDEIDRRGADNVSDKVLVHTV